MDPNATLEMVLEAIRNGDAETAAEYLGYLNDWISKGGFQPEQLATISDDARYAAHSIPAPTGRRDVDECHDDSLDFRIFIRPEGTVELATGDASYDTDHRGGCGCGSVSRHDSRKDIRAAVADAFFDAADSMIETL